MRKILSLFQRNYYTYLARDEVVPGAEWVINGEGVATRKLDGTCCMIRDGELFKRYDTKRGKTPPAYFEPAQDYDTITGQMPGWVPVGNGPDDQWHCEAFNELNEDTNENPENGTYELLGPKIQGNPEGVPEHRLFRHGMTILLDCPTTFDGLRKYLAEINIEGIVWHHPDGRMVKIKGKDFGIKRK